MHGDHADPPATDRAATATYAAVLAHLFPTDHPGRVRTLGDDDDANFTGTPPPPPTRPDVPGFVVEDRLGGGGSGEVWRAVDVRLRRTVALKFLRADAGQDAPRLEREAQLLGRCSHPNIVHAYQVAACTETHVCLAMEYVHGATLGEWLRRAPRHPRRLLHLMTAVGRALEAAHDAGVIHRDLKPSNIMVDEHGRPRLIDFGLAHADKPAPTPSSPTATRAEPTVGTPHYIAPEHMRGDACTARSDQYSFCVVLYECIYRHLPAPGLRRLPSRPRLQRHIRRAILRGLDPVPAQRWPAMDPLLRALTPRPWWRHPAFFMTTIVLLVGAALAVRELGAELRRTAEYDACTSTIAEKWVHLLATAQMLGLAAKFEPDPGTGDALCDAAMREQRPEKRVEVDQLLACLDTHIQALDTYSSLVLQHPTREHGPRIRHDWGQLRTPLPPFVPCEPQQSSTGSRTLGGARHLDNAVSLVQLRILIHAQQYGDAARLLANRGILARLRDSGDQAALAEALLYAGQVVRRHQQQRSPIVIDGLDAEQLLNLAEVEAAASGQASLLAFIRIEHVHLALDASDLQQAEVLRSLIRVDGVNDHPELQIRLLQLEARIAAAERRPGDAALIAEAALARLEDDPRLSGSTLPIELLGARALYVTDSDPEHALNYHRSAVSAALTALGPRHHLTGLLAANASRHAYEARSFAEGEDWGKAALVAYEATYGENSLPAEEVTYDLAFNLFHAGEAARALPYAERALASARILDLPSEVAFSLQLRSAIELRMARFEAAHRSALAAAAALPGQFDADLHALLELHLRTTEAELRSDRSLDRRLDRFAEGIALARIPALKETRIELQVLRAQVSARLGHVRTARRQLAALTTAELDGIEDRLLRGDAYLARAHLSERSGELDAARRDTCTAMDLFAALGSDGHRRITALTGDRAGLPPSPSPRLTAACLPAST